MYGVEKIAEMGVLPVRVVRGKVYIRKEPREQGVIQATTASSEGINIFPIVIERVDNQEKKLRRECGQHGVLWRSKCEKCGGLNDEGEGSSCIERSGGRKTLQYFASF